MEVNSNQSNRKAELEEKIRVLEDTKAKLQQDIAKIQETLTTAVLEKKAKGLEGEINNLRNIKMKLTEKPVAKEEDIITKKQVTSPNSPIRYGTWSKLPVP